MALEIHIWRQGYCLKSRKISFRMRLLSVTLPGKGPSKTKKKKEGGAVSWLTGKSTGQECTRPGFSSLLPIRKAKHICNSSQRKANPQSPWSSQPKWWIVDSVGGYSISQNKKQKDQGTSNVDVWPPCTHMFMLLHACVAILHAHTLTYTTHTHRGGQGWRDGLVSESHALQT